MRHTTRGLDASINVTPLVDVVLVLLIIFMVVTPMMTVGYDATFAGEAGPGPALQPRSPVVVRLTSGGAVEVDREPTTLTALHAVLAARLRPGQVAILDADDQVSYPDALVAMDAIRAAGGTTGVQLR